MTEPSGAEFALQVALETLRNRCQQFQKRITELEVENVNLRSTVIDNTELGSLSHNVHTPHLQISQLIEEKAQLSKKVDMVTAENNNLWSHIFTLTQAKGSVDIKLTKIGDSISSRTHTNLIRSKTFTQDQPHLIIPQENIQCESEKLSLELEDISLKLIDSIAKEKEYLEMQCTQMDEIQGNDSLFSNPCTFIHTSEIVTGYDKLEKQLTALRSLKSTLLNQRDKLEKVVGLVASPANGYTTLKITNSTSMQTPNHKEVQTDVENVDHQSSIHWETPKNLFFNNNIESHENNTKATINNACVGICPICSNIFEYNTNFHDFQLHVEEHFKLENVND